MKSRLNQGLLATAAALGAMILLPLPSAYAQTVHVNDDLESSNNWIIHRPASPADPTNIAEVRYNDPDWTSNTSLWVNGGSFRRVSPHAVPTNADPVIFQFDFYDFGADTSTGHLTVYGELQARSGVVPLFAAGLATASWDATGWSTTSAPHATHDPNRYQARVNPGSNWIQLNTLRSIGWQTFKFVIRRDTFDIYVNGVLDPNADNLSWAGIAPSEANPLGSLNELRMGGGFSTVGLPAHFDNIYLANDTAAGRDLNFTQQPQGAFRPFQGTVTFTAEAAGSWPITYRWTKDGVELNGSDPRFSGVNSGSLTISNLTPADSGNYRLKATNSVTGTIWSNPANLYVMSEFERIVDNADPTPQFTLTPAVADWTLGSSSAAWNGNFRWRSLTSSETPTHTATFRPEIGQTGRYDLYTRYAQGTNRATKAPYIVSSLQGEQTVYINQQTNGGTWVLVAKDVEFAQGTDGFVRITNVRATDGAGDLVVADAVRWIPVVEIPTLVAPRISIARGIGGVMNFQVRGGANASHQVEWSADLVQWAPFGSVELDENGHGVFSDPAASGLSRRFYRVK